MKPGEYLLFLRQFHNQSTHSFCLLYLQSLRTDQSKPISIQVVLQAQQSQLVSGDRILTDEPSILSKVLILASIFKLNLLSYTWPYLVILGLLFPRSTSKSDTKDKSSLVSGSDISTTRASIHL